MLSGLCPNLQDPKSEKLDGFEMKVEQYSDQSDDESLDKILTMMVSEGVGNPTVKQKPTLNDTTLDTYDKIMDTVASYISARKTLVPVPLLASIPCDLARFRIRRREVDPGL